MGKPLSKFHILRHVAYNLESIIVMAAGENAMRQWVCMIFEFAPYSRRRCLTPGVEEWQVLLG